VENGYERGNVATFPNAHGSVSLSQDGQYGDGIKSSATGCIGEPFVRNKTNLLALLEDGYQAADNTRLRSGECGSRRSQSDGHSRRLRAEIGVRSESGSFFGYQPDPGSFCYKR
jgi:hypothetical protein